ncbi:MAG: exodeoxyribonuclease VII large subunit [Candidatus Aureabacteria bacterium]|nr:exodeoxyribonuclease VII large subunit [Candidatus Auribacterota bacterium]
MSQPTGKKIYSVSELTREIKVLLEGRFPGVWVEGEISNIRKPGSGHIYFTLKDEGSQLQAVLYRSQLMRNRFDLRDGLQVIAFGDVSVYARGGRYQLTVAEIEPRGLGALQLAFEQLKQRLALEGLFAPERKKPIPLLPERIGIVTSPTGAAIRDILTVIQRRFANVRILISPARVQGETAVGEIAGAIDGFNARADVDVIIVTRGGGSLEDLWAFNEEAVARAIARSRIPVISAVGHEIDYTISDFVADLRVPTPSAAAELVIAQKSELQGKIETLASKLSSAISERIASLRNRWRLCEQSYVFQAPRTMVRQHQQLLDELESRLQRSFRHAIELIRNRLGAVGGKLESLSPLAVLARGYSVIIREKDGAVVSAAGQVARGDIVRARLHRGGFTASVREIVDTTP